MRRPLHRHYFLLTMILLTTLACSLPRTLFEFFISPNDLDSQTVATWEVHQATENSIEVVEESAMETPENQPEEPTSNPQPEQSSLLTMQEQNHLGAHNYAISGTTTPMFNGDGVVSDSGICVSEFSAEGVNFQMQDFNAGFFQRVADNRYEQVTEAETRITLEYTDTAILYYSIQKDGVFLDLTLSLDD